MSRPLILVIEDDHAIRQALCLSLDMLGYDVVSAANGQEGLTTLTGAPSSPRPCLILLDLMMPVMDGWEFVEALSTDETLARIPVVGVTAFAERAGSLPARAILKKPVELSALMKVVKTYCGGTATC
jgi:CheY-like chemotaxis protein